MKLFNGQDINWISYEQGYRAYKIYISAGVKTNNPYKKETVDGIAGIKDGTSVDMVYVTIDWAGNPITTKGDGYILPRKAEMIFE